MLSGWLVWPAYVRVLLQFGTAPALIRPAVTAVGGTL